MAICDLCLKDGDGDDPCTCPPRSWPGIKQQADAQADTPTPIYQRASIGSHTPTDFGPYDDEPFETSMNAYNWYLHACYWKQKASRNEGTQATMRFEQKKSGIGPDGTIILSDKDLAIVKSHIKTFLNGGYGKTNAIKHVRNVVNCGLKEAIDYVNDLDPSE
jgi:hypothetical protein